MPCSVDGVKHFVDLSLDRGMEWRSCRLRIQQRAKSGQDRGGTYVLIDEFAEGLATHLALFIRLELTTRLIRARPLHSHLVF